MVLETALSNENTSVSVAVKLCWKDMLAWYLSPQLLAKSFAIYLFVLLLTLPLYPILANILHINKVLPELSRFFKLLLHNQVLVTFAIGTGFCLILVANTLQALRILHNYPSLQVPNTYIFSKKFIKYESSLTQGELKWPSFTEVTEDKTKFLFYMHKSAALIVPKRFFNSKTDLDNLKEIIRCSATKFKLAE